jgi:hypothetical protein
VARILHLDDKSDQCHVIREALEDHSVCSVGTLQDAQTALRDGPDYDLALVTVMSTSGPDLAGAQLLRLLVAGYPSIYRVLVTEWSLPPAETTRIFDRYPVDEIIDCEGRNAQRLSTSVGSALAVNQRRIPHQTKIYRSELRHEIKSFRRVSGAEIRDHVNAMEEFVTATSLVPRQGHRAEQEIDRSRLVLRDIDQEFERLAEKVEQITTPQAASLLREDLQRVKMMFTDERALWANRM